MEPAQKPLLLQLAKLSIENGPEDNGIKEPIGDGHPPISAEPESDTSALKAPETDSDSLDKKTIDLLEELDQYTQITSAWRQQLIDAFVLLSRANYVGSKRFGLECFDMRPYNAQATVTLGDGIVLTRGSQKVEDSATAEAEPENTLRQRKVAKGPEEHEQDKSLAKEKPQEKEKPLKKKQLQPASGEKSLDLDRDPLLQFGAMVPPALRQAQTAFQKALTQAIAVANSQIKLSTLVSELEAHQA